MTSQLRHSQQRIFNQQSRCFELVFLQLQLLKILYKSIAIQLSYERKKKGAFL